MTEKKYYLRADLEQCSYVQEKTRIVTKCKHIICIYLINCKILNR